MSDVERLFVVLVIAGLVVGTGALLNALFRPLDWLRRVLRVRQTLKQTDQSVEWRSQAIRLTAGPGEMPAVQVSKLEPLAALEATDKLAEKQGGAHLVEADRAATDPDVAWALRQWHLQQQSRQKRQRWER